MIALAAVLGSLGLICMATRRTLLGLMIGAQLLALGSSLVLVVAGHAGGRPIEGSLFGFMVLFTGVSQLVVGYALCVRLFYLKKHGALSQLRDLKR